ncbi:hypothetical protein [Sphingomonas azotifigens]|uniref:hypothetical protein n=1 Tax=Sphingomonas azotifigens TaxID=330920 RepID=UPI0009FEF97D|nr:hypothetical protein [Sphingomonas azotifigens]
MRFDDCDYVETAHRDGVALHYGRDDFADRDKLARTLSRERAKDMASDYARDPEQAFAERRGISLRERVAEIVRAGAEKARGIFDGFKPTTPAPRERDMFADFRPTPREPAAHEPARASGARGAVERYARARHDIERMRESGLAAMPHQQAALERATAALDAVRPHGSTDLRAAFQHSPDLIREAAEGRGQGSLRAMQLEAELRIDPVKRADKFVEGWQRLERQREALQRDGNLPGARKLSGQLAGMAKSLERDPQMESLLRPRRHEFGIDADMGRNLARDLVDHVSFEPTRSLGMSR